MALIDVGTFPHRSNQIEGLARPRLAPSDVVLTHSHYDDSINWVLFPWATIWIGAAEMKWAIEDLWGPT